MLGQYRLMQTHALGSFRDLLIEMGTDPAMMVWLDTIDSTKGNPNENYARELMELFSLGIGNYTEADIREAAKAFTGYEIKDGKGVLNREPARRRREDRLRQERASSRAKTSRSSVSNRTRARASSSASSTAFSSASRTTPPAELIDPLAKQYREWDFDTGKLVATMLRSNLFFSPARVPREDQVAGRVRGRASFAGWKARPARCRWRRRSKDWGRSSSRRRR